MPDLSTGLPTPELEEAYLGVVDVEGKLIAALEDLGPIAGRDVTLLDAGRGFRARHIAETGARVTTVTFTDPRDVPDAVERMERVPAGEADVVIAMWSELATPGSMFLTAAERLLRPGGRLLIVHDYGRDDVWALLPQNRDRVIEWSQRRGPFLGDGFRVRVIHCWWSFASIDEARILLQRAFGEAGAAMAAGMKRLRLEYQVAIYHRTAEVPALELQTEGAPRFESEHEYGLESELDPALDPDTDHDSPAVLSLG